MVRSPRTASGSRPAPCWAPWRSPPSSSASFRRSFSIGASMVIRMPAVCGRVMDPAQRNRGLFAEIASIVFPSSFFILLVGVIYGNAAVFVGNAAVVEGDSFVETRANYDNLREGKL